MTLSFTPFVLGGAGEGRGGGSRSAERPDGVKDGKGWHERKQRVNGTGQGYGTESETDLGRRPRANRLDFKWARVVNGVR